VQLIRSEDRRELAPLVRPAASAATEASP